jgi:hypothetical protein
MYLRTNDIPKINISAEYNNVNISLIRNGDDYQISDQLTSELSNTTQHLIGMQLDTQTISNVKMTVARLFHELVARGELTVNDQEKVFDIEKTINYRR